MEENAASQTDERHVFDRLVLANGQLSTPHKIDIKGIEKFEGDAVHSVQFKDPSRYEGKNVLIVGVGATGADTQSFLQKAKARSVHMSHRGQYYLSAEHRIPVFSSNLAENLRDGVTKSVQGVSEVTGPRSVAFTDGTVLHDIDAIIICTGYHFDFSLLRDAGDPTDPTKAPDHYERINAARYKDPHVSFPRLYRGFISEQYPESLAVIGHFLLAKPTFVLNDLATMALASIWSGAAPLPTREEMARDINSHYDTIVSTLKRGPVPHMGFRMFGSKNYEWVNKVAGTGVTDRLACFSLEAWKLWWNDRTFYNLLMDGVDEPAVYRLFETGRGRKPWSGAREQILKTNDEVNQMAEKWKKENSPKSK
ncbi:monooxygenase aurF [Colletotrichum spaethianum]|uniref:Monooxygenase aurF n=1 Tax=Colletotrichum spaethianum TaxID=700344 RepID=A0AA37LCZ9_9PEZI|nr:monooxygenase aurF [Colletotrichum spaethianum]GKT46232.1 monooxygenase aurF [Colletotrichum spaethianum]